MYSPVKDGIEKTIRLVEYTEVQPPADLSELVQCFWELKTTASLDKDFILHAIPDACVDIMFNEVDTDVAGVTSLHTTYKKLNLGRNFHYVGIQFLPGVWRGNQNDIAHQYIGTAYKGGLPLIKTNCKMAGLSFSEKRSIMAELVRELADKKLVTQNPLIAKILTHLSAIYTVADMAKLVGISSRQLQRVLHKDTGFKPHDFLKVLRLQQAIKRGYRMLYADQSHFIHSFKEITGYTPAQYFDKFNV